MVIFVVTVHVLSRMSGRCRIQGVGSFVLDLELLHRGGLQLWKRTGSTRSVVQLKPIQAGAVGRRQPSLGKACFLWNVPLANLLCVFNQDFLGTNCHLSS